MSKKTCKEIRDEIDKLFEESGFTKNDKLSELALMAAITLIELGSDNCEVNTPIASIKLDVDINE